MNDIKPCTTGEHFWLPAPSESGEGMFCYSCPTCNQRIYWSPITQNWVNVTKSEPTNK